MTGSRKRFTPSLSRGFTLLEVIIAMGIFAMAIVIISGLFSRFVFTQRRDIGEQALEEDIRFAMELFNRETRLAYASTYALTDATGQSLVMRNQNGLCVNYKLNTTLQRIERAETEQDGTDCLGASFGGFSPLTSNRVRIENLRFDLPDNIYNQSDARLDRQGFITVMISARSTNQSTPPIQIQSSVTSRQVIPYEEQ